MRVPKKILRKQKPGTGKKQLFKARLRAIRRQSAALTISFVLVVTATIIVPPQKAEAAIAFRSSSTYDAISGASLVINKPAGVISGDVLVISIASTDDNICNASAAGWVQINYVSGVTTNERCLKTLYHVAGGSEPASYTFTLVETGFISAGIQAFSGVDITDVIDNGGASKSSNTGTSTTATALGFTTVRSNSMLVVSFSSDNDTFSTVAGMTERFQLISNFPGLAADDGIQAVAGATGNKTSTLGGNDFWIAQMVALKAARPGLDQSAFRFLSNMDVNDSLDIVSNPSAGDDTIRGLASDSANGFFYIGGYIGNGTTWIVEKRRIDDGSKDVAFTYPTPAAGFVGGIAIDPVNNAVFVVGQTTGTVWRIEKRRMSDGQLCSAAMCGTAFGAGGVLLPGISGSLNNIDIDPVNGYIYVGGFDSAGGEQWRTAKYSTLTGAADTSFTQGGCGAPTSGSVCSNPSGGSDRIRTITVDPQNGYVYTGGWDAVNTNQAWRIEKRRISDGALCTGGACGTNFGTSGSGAYRNNITAGTDQLLALQVDTPGNAIYAGGYDSTAGNQWHLEKLRADSGALCDGAGGCTGGAFDTDGIITYNSGAGDDQLLDLDLDDAGGFLYTTGQDLSSAGAGNVEWRIEKRNRGDGALVTSFGSTGCTAAGAVPTSIPGVVCVNPSANIDAPAWIAVDLPRNLLYTSGGDRTLGAANQQWRIQKFDLDYGDVWLNSPQDTAAMASTNITFRLRLLLHINTVQLGIGDETLKLQYASKVGTCDTGFVDEVYTDVTTSSNEIRYYNNASLADGVTLAAGLPGDPVHSGHTTVRQSIEEVNAFSSVATVPTGQDGLWDFTMRDFNAFGAYCFRVVYNDATPTLLNDPVLDGSYDVIPEINFCRNTPTTDALLRGGTYFCSGTKRAFFWAKD